MTIARVSGKVNQRLLSTNQLPAIITTPVRRIVQGWHHQGFDCQRLAETILVSIFLVEIYLLNFFDRSIQQN